MLKDFVVKSCTTFRGRVEAVIECNGSYIEYIIRFDIIYQFYEYPFVLTDLLMVNK